MITLSVPTFQPCVRVCVCLACLLTQLTVLSLDSYQSVCYDLPSQSSLLVSGWRLLSLTCVCMILCESSQAAERLAASLHSLCSLAPLSHSCNQKKVLAINIIWYVYGSIKFSIDNQNVCIQITFLEKF